jgi:aspartyl-tRNA(Asn)/glutamyl-tRNA(Gln) amidotransferase subunit A
MPENFVSKTASISNRALSSLSASEQADLIRTRQVSPVDLIQECLGRIDSWDATLRAWITVEPEAALAEARLAEQEIAQGRYKGPLHGLPFGVKDQMHALGFPTTLGTRVLNESEMKAPYDCAVVERLRSAGAIMLGKQNMHEFGKGGTIEFPYGNPCNPWNPLYSASSSSTGSGSATAANMCSFSIGEDTGGSIRGPAAFNSVVGLRPTFGRVSRFGALMSGYNADTLGPLARSVRDVAAIMEVISGADARDPLCTARPVDNYTAALGQPIAGLKIGIVREIASNASVDPEVGAAFDVAVEVLRSLGATIVDISLPLAMYAVPLQLLTVDADVASQHLAENLRERYDRYDNGTRTRLAAASLIPATAYNRAMRARVIVRRQILDAFGTVDALISPTSLTPPKLTEQMEERVDDSDDAVRRLMERRIAIYPFSLANVPAMSVPMGFSKLKLPLALQIAAKPFAESMVFQIGHAYEQATEWHRMQPDLEQTLGTPHRSS